MAEITIKDVAKKCGVGVSTVSRAINNHPDINQETKAKILQVIQKSGYIPNNSARNLKRSEAKTVAVLAKGLNNPFFSDMIRIIEGETKKRQHSLVLRHVDEKEDEVDAALELVKEKRLKGIVFLGGYFSHAREKLEKLGVPFVFGAVGAVPGDISQTAYSHISVDDRQESCRMVDYLMEQGHEKIAIIAAGPDDRSVGMLRLEGYLDAFRKRGMEPEKSLVCRVSNAVAEYSMENGYLTAQKLLRAGTPFTALFATSDILAMGALRALKDADIPVPRQVSVAGFDGLELGNYFVPRLTTMKQPVAEMAGEIVRLLFSLIEEKGPHRHIVLPASLVVRESAGKRDA